jgi:hypothetical protein
MAARGWDRRTFLARMSGMPLLLALTRAMASETAVALLRIGGMTCGT